MGVPFDMVVVREFVLARVANYETLEVLLSLFRCRRAMALDDLAEALVLSPLDVSRVAEQLVRLEIVDALSGDGGTSYCYAPRTAELARGVEQVAVAYEHDRVWLIKLMTKNAIERVRTNATRAFARKKDD